jgi:hypothetical protein
VTSEAIPSKKWLPTQLGLSRVIAAINLFTDDGAKAKPPLSVW